jgi:hypothetical protein
MGSQDAGGGNSALSRMVSCQQTISTGDSVGAGGTKPSIFFCRQLTCCWVFQIVGVACFVAIDLGSMPCIVGLGSDGE